MDKFDENGEISVLLVIKGLDDIEDLNVSLVKVAEENSVTEYLELGVCITNDVKEDTVNADDSWDDKAVEVCGGDKMVDVETISDVKKNGVELENDDVVTVRWWVEVTEDISPDEDTGELYSMDGSFELFVDAILVLTVDDDATIWKLEDGDELTTTVDKTSTDKLMLSETGSEEYIDCVIEMEEKVDFNERLLDVENDGSNEWEKETVDTA